MYMRITVVPSLNLVRFLAIHPDIPHGITHILDPTGNKAKQKCKN